LIEDDIGSIAMLRRALSRSGYQVLVATNYPDAISTAEHEHPSAFLVSSTLGGGDAAQLVEGLRAISPDGPLLLLGEDPGIGERALPRPIQIAQLLEQLRRELSPRVTEDDAVPEPPGESSGAAPTPTAADPPAPPPAALATAAVLPPAAPPAPPSVDAEAQRRRDVAEAVARRRAEASRVAASAPRPTAAPSPAAPPSPPETKPAPEPVAQARSSAAASAARPASAASPASPASPVAAPRAPAIPERTERTERAKPEPKPPFPPAGFAVALEGHLGEVEVVEILAASARAKLTGRLQLIDGPVTRALFWDQGRISGAASNSPDERLEALAYRRGLLTSDQRRLLRSEAETATRRLALLMVERGYIKPAELFPLVQERVEEIAYEACGVDSGRYAIDAQTVPDDERVALSRSPFSVLTEGVRRKFLMERLLSKLSGPATLLRPREGGVDLADLGLTARERRMAELVDGLRNIEELLFETGIEPLAGLKILYALLLAGGVEISVPGISVDETAEASRRIDLGRVDEKYEQVRAANYFDILGVSERATPYEVQQAYDRLAREFQPARFGDLNRIDLAERLEEIQRVLAEARDVLVDDRLRQDYGRHARR
jgi:CheY-like chemotaxis protein